MGKDEYCGCIYTWDGESKVVSQEGYIKFLMCLKVDPLNLRLVDTLDNVNLITKIGGFF